MNANDWMHFAGLQIGGMSAEMTALALATILGLVQLLIAARMYNGQRGLKWNLGARDGTPPPISQTAARMDRAFANFMETFPFFAVAVIACALLGRHSWASVWGTQIYLAARLIYVPLYAFGIFGLRTLIWLISVIGIALVIAAWFGV